MSEKLPPALREALEADFQEDGFAGMPDAFIKDDRARCMAAALRWVVKMDILVDALEFHVDEAIAALEQEAKNE